MYVCVNCQLNHWGTMTHARERPKELDFHNFTHMYMHQSRHIVNWARNLLNEVTHAHMSVTQQYCWGWKYIRAVHILTICTYTSHQPPPPHTHTQQTTQSHTHTPTYTWGKPSTLAIDMYTQVHYNQCTTPWIKRQVYMLYKVIHRAGHGPLIIFCSHAGRAWKQG